MYKTILVHADESATSAHRVEVAARLAARFDAHLVGVAITGLSAFMLPMTGLDAGFPPVAFPIEQLHADAARALDLFERAALGAATLSCERRMVDDEAGFGMSLHARYSDLVVVSQMGAAARLPRVRSDFPEYVLLNSVRPVLVIPATHEGADPGSKVTVAWNGSAEALRAITSAIPLLQRAQQVDLVVFNARAEPDAHGEDPGADMALYLARHNVKVTVFAADEGRDDGGALLSFAADRGADLIVMGAYGHSRLREFVLGGMTRTALRNSIVPLWMAH